MILYDVNRKELRLATSSANNYLNFEPPDISFMVGEIQQHFAYVYVCLATWLSDMHWYPSSKSSSRRSAASSTSQQQRGVFTMSFAVLFVQKCRNVRIDDGKTGGMKQATTGHLTLQCFRMLHLHLRMFLALPKRHWHIALRSRRSSSEHASSLGVTDARFFSGVLQLLQWLQRAAYIKNLTLFTLGSVGCSNQ